MNLLESYEIKIYHYAKYHSLYLINNNF